jgi:predicted MFS family arabinose efflux permease
MTGTSAVEKTAAPVRLRWQLAAFVLVRIAVNTGYRMVYPFLPAIARGLGVDLSTAAYAVTLRSGAGLATPLLGSATDVWGRKTAMLSGLGLFVGGMALIGLWPTYPALVIALLFSGLGRLAFDASVQTYIGDRVDYTRRGTAIAISEFGWSGAFLIGIPIVGWLIARSGWVAPFPWLAALSGVGLLILWRLIPDEGRTVEPGGSVRRNLWNVARSPVALAALSITLLVAFSNEVVSIVYGAWMENAYGLRVAALGTTSIVIGLAELGGEGLVAGFTDRLGKHRAVGIGITVNALAALVISQAGAALPAALIGLFLFFISYEFLFVSLISLLTELVTESRATLLGTNLAIHSAGRMIGALVGPLAFRSGIQANCLITIAACTLALVLLLTVVRKSRQVILN